MMFLKSKKKTKAYAINICEQNSSIRLHYKKDELFTKRTNVRRLESYIEILVLVTTFKKHLKKWI